MEFEPSTWLITVTLSRWLGRGRGLMLLQSGLIANVKLHFLIFLYSDMSCKANFYLPHQRRRNRIGAVFLCVHLSALSRPKRLTFALIDFWYGSWPGPLLCWNCRSRSKVKVTGNISLLEIRHCSEMSGPIYDVTSDRHSRTSRDIA